MRYLSVSLLVLLASLTGFGQTAAFMVFHASADPNLSEVDVYYDQFLLHPGLAFRQLSFRQEVLAGTPYQIEVTLPNTDTTVASTRLTPASEREYILLLTGVRTPANFAPNPDGMSTAAKLLSTELPMSAADPNRVELVFVHAVTDAPTVRILRPGGQPLYTGSASFGSLLDGLLPADTLTIEFYTLGGTLLARFRGDLRDYEGQTGVLVLSGFAQPGRNQNGPELGLHAVLLDGTIVPFQRVDTQTQTARLQLVHASPDPQLAAVDVYLNGQKVLDDFGFRSATPLQELPAGVPLTVGIAPSTSQSVADTFRSFSAVLPSGSTLCAVVCGLLSPQDYAPNPSGRSTELSVVVVPVQERASSSTAVALATVHAVTDAPAVTLTAFGTSLAQGLVYGEAAPYRELPAGSDTLQGLPLRYRMELTPYAGQAGVLILTGFAHPEANRNGPALAPIIVLPSGTVVELSPVTSIEEPTTPGSPRAWLVAENRWLRLPIPEQVPGPMTIELFTLTGARIAHWEFSSQQWGGHTVELPPFAARGIYLCRVWAPPAGRSWWWIVYAE